MTYKISTKTKVTSQGDGWGRGRIVQPVYAVAGANDTGNWSDSPNPSYEVSKELDRLKKELKSNNIQFKEVGSPSSNLFMGRRWIVVSAEQFSMAKKISDKFIKEHESDTQYIYGAD